MGVFGWLASAARNAIADPRIQAADGASARTFPASLREFMASIRWFADDQGGALRTAGAVNLYTVTTNSKITEFRAGVRLVVQADRTNTGAATLVVDGIVKPWRDASGNEFAAGFIVQGQFYTVYAYPDDGSWRTELTPAAIANVAGLPAYLAGLVSGSSVSFIPAGATGAVARLLLEFLGDTINVRSYPQTQAGLAQAIADAKAGNKRLFLPAGEYVSTGNLPDLHNVEAFGTGIVKRSIGGVDYSYAVTPPYSTAGAPFANTLYVDPAGSSANDGLSPSHAFATIAQAFTALVKKGPFLRGLWTIRLAAGTYAGAGLSGNLGSLAQVTIIGPDVPWPTEPTAIIDGTATPSGAGLSFGANQNIVVRNIAIKNFSSGAGIGCKDGFVSIGNVHLINNYVGISAGRCTVTATAPFLIDCSNPTTGTIIPESIAINAIFYVHLTFNFDAAPENLRPIIRKASIGILGQEFSTGHVDGIYITDCGTGIAAKRETAFNTASMHIWRCGIGIQWFPGCSVLDNNIDFGEGTANACTRPRLFSGGVEIFRRQDTLQLLKVNGRNDNDLVIAYDTIGTSEFAFLTPMKIKAGDISAVYSGIIADVTYSMIHELKNDFTFIVRGAQTQSATVRMYIGSVNPSFLAGFFTVEPGAVGVTTDLEFRTDIVSVIKTRTRTRRHSASGVSRATREIGINLRTGADLPIIFTWQWQGADPGASAAIFMSKHESTLGRCPF